MEENADEDGSGIVSYDEDDGYSGDTCENCGKTKQEEEDDEG
jgi:hypothetical protein